MYEGTLAESVIKVDEREILLLRHALQLYSTSNSCHRINNYYISVWQTGCEIYSFTSGLSCLNFLKIFACANSCNYYNNDNFINNKTKK
jgi:hypothetical protein